MLNDSEVLDTPASELNISLQSFFGEEDRKFSPIPNRVAVDGVGSAKARRCGLERKESSPRDRCMCPIHDGEEGNEELV